MLFVRKLVLHPFWSLRATWPPVLLFVLAVLVAFSVPVPWLSGLVLVGACVLIFDSLARHRQFAALRLVVRRAGGLSGEALAQFRQARRSWCSRTAAMAAADAEGHGRQARHLVREWGYRPWHVFPDGAFRRRSTFLRLDFWKSVLGISRG